MNKNSKLIFYGLIGAIALYFTLIRLPTEGLGGGLISGLVFLFCLYRLYTTWHEEDDERS